MTSLVDQLFIDEIRVRRMMNQGAAVDACDPMLLPHDYRLTYMRILIKVHRSIAGYLTVEQILSKPITKYWIMRAHDTINAALYNCLKYHTSCTRLQRSIHAKVPAAKSRCCWSITVHIYMLCELIWVIRNVRLT